MSNKLFEKIAGAVYGMALGDAMGMPPELWSRKRAFAKLGIINDFIDGPADNEAACYYKAGQFTDDTSQALVIIDALNENSFIPNQNLIAQKLLVWAEKTGAFEKNILGPSSKSALLAFKKNEFLKSITDAALTNGAAMRIAPVGCLFFADELPRLAGYVFDVSKVTHSSDIAAAGAALIAAAVCAAMETGQSRAAVEAALLIYEQALNLGAETFSPSIKRRVELGFEFFNKNENEFLRFVYECIGAGVCASESVPAALLIASYAEDPNRAALLAANLGGDTDTIGAMASAICGAAHGVSAIKSSYIQKLKSANNIDFESYISKLIKGREVLHE